MSHFKSEINFDKGINVIIGKNGTGKSTIVKAISVCLLTLKGSGLTKENIKNKWLNRNPIVELEISHNKNEYGLKYYNDGYFVRYNSKKYLPYSYGKYKEFIHEKLYDEDIIKNAMLIFQEDIKTLSLDRKIRVNTIKKFVGLEEAYDSLKILEKFRDFLDSNIRENEKLILLLKEDVNEEVFKEKNVIEKDLEALKQKKVSLLEKHNLLKNKIEELENKIKEYENLKKQKEIIENEISINKERETLILKDIDNLSKNIIEESIYLDLKNKINLKEKYIKLKEKEESIIKKLKEIEEQLKFNKYDKNLIDYFKNYEEKYNEFKRIKRTIEELKKEMMSNFEDKYSRLQELENLKINERISLYKFEIENLNNKIIEISEKIREIENNDICPICKSNLTKDKKDNLIKEYYEEIEELHNKINKLKEKIEELLKLKKEYDILKNEEKRILLSLENKKKIEILEEKLRDLDVSFDFEKLKEDYMKELEKMNRYNLYLKEKQKLEEELLLVRKEIPHIDFDIDNLPSIDVIERKYSNYLLLKKLKKELEEIKNKQNILNGKLRVIMEQLNEFPSDSKILIVSLDNFKKEYEENYKILSDMNQQIGYYTSKLENLEKEIEKQGELKEKISTLEKETKEINRILKKVKEHISIINDYIEYIKNEALPQIVDIASEIFARLSDYEFERLEYVQHKDDFDIFAIKRGEYFDPKNLSGGQQTMYSLALRFAIGLWSKKAYDIDKLDCIVIDEPTIHLDDSAIERLRNEIENLGLEQIIIVTHDQIFPKIANKVFEVKIKNGFSVVEEKT